MRSVDRDIGRGEVLADEAAVVCLCVCDADVLGEHRGADGIGDRELAGDHLVGLEAQRGAGGRVASRERTGGEHGRNGEGGFADCVGAFHGYPFGTSVPIRRCGIGGRAWGFETARKLRVEGAVNRRHDRHGVCIRVFTGGSASFPDALYADAGEFSASRAGCPGYVGVVR